MAPHEPSPSWPDPHTYYLPWLRFTTAQGNRTDGPWVRQDQGRRELVAWTTREAAEAAARELAGQTGARWVVRAVGRPELRRACRDFAFGVPMAAVILK